MVWPSLMEPTSFLFLPLLIMFSSHCFFYQFGSFFTSHGPISFWISFFAFSDFPYPFIQSILFWFQMFGLYLSTFLVVVIGLDRWAAISQPLKRTQSGKGRAKIWTWTAWLLSALFSLPQVRKTHFLMHIDSYSVFLWDYCNPYFRTLSSVQIIRFGIYNK